MYVKSNLIINTMETQVLALILFVGTAILNWDIISGNSETIQKED